MRFVVSVAMYQQKYTGVRLQTEVFVYSGELNEDEAVGKAIKSAAENHEGMTYSHHVVVDITDDPS